MLERLRASARRLGAFPRMGRMLPGFERDALRELIVDDYRLVYELSGDVVAIATVLHGSQDVDARLHELWPDLS